ncbi:MAG: HD domain-containing phosphohydrolase [Planctomycetota bacterium]
MHSPQSEQIAAQQRRIAELTQERNDLSHQLGDCYEELSLIYTLSGGMKLTRAPQQFFDLTAEQTLEVMQVETVGIHFWHERVHPTTNFQYGKPLFNEDELDRLHSGMREQLGLRRETIHLNEIVADRHFAWSAQRAERLLAVPLERGDELFGVIWVANKRPVPAPPTGTRFTSIDAKLLNGVAVEVGIHAENYTLFDDAKSLMMGLLHSLTAAVDAKDAYTCGHSERVALLSRELAKQADFSTAYQERVYMAGLLHDVGKIGVPDMVIRKPGKLTDEEFGEIKKHPEIGARILADVRQVADLIDGVRHHHERFDGRGYPWKLAGEAIPLMGRIICLADCFDAMTSNRTYRNGMPPAKALAEIERCKGSQFDPALADAFLDIGEARIEELLKDHRDGVPGAAFLNVRPNSEAA